MCMQLHYIFKKKNFSLVIILLDLNKILTSMKDTCVSKKMKENVGYLGLIYTCSTFWERTLRVGVLLQCYFIVFFYQQNEIY